MWRCLSKRKAARDESGSELAKIYEGHDHSESCLPSYLDLESFHSLPSYQQASFEPSKTVDRAADIMQHEMQKEKPALRDMSSKIHQHPELAFNERYAADVLTQYMQSRGWDVERGICGLETAWRATFTHGKGGRVVGFNCEMDVSMTSLRIPPDETGLALDRTCLWT